MKRVKNQGVTMGARYGTNTLSELLSFWVLLWFVKKRGILEFNVMGDSKEVIELANRKNSMSFLHFYNWTQRIRTPIHFLQAISFIHIYRIFNEEAYSL